MKHPSADSDSGLGAVLVALLVAAFFIGLYWLYYQSRYDDCMESKHDAYICNIYAGSHP